MGSERALPSRVRNFVAGLAAILGASACHEYTTQVTVKDPYAVAIYSGKADGSAPTLEVPAGREDASTLYYGPVPPIFAKRVGRELHLVCDMCLFGDGTLLDSAGKSGWVDGSASDQIAGTFGEGDMMMSRTLTVGSGAVAGGILTQSVMPVIATPWTNVQAVEQTRTPERWGGWTVLLTGALITAVGVALPSSGGGSGKTDVLAIGIGMDLVGAYYAFFPTITTQVYPKRGEQPASAAAATAAVETKPPPARLPPAPGAGDRDLDTFPDGADECPAEAEVYNGMKDDDGCPDKGGKPRVMIDDKTSPPVLAVFDAPRFKPGSSPPELDAATTATARAIGQQLLLHRTWTVKVGLHPKGATDAARADASAKAEALATAIRGFADRTDAASAAAWDDVKDTQSARTGLGVVVAITAPLRFDGLYRVVDGQDSYCLRFWADGTVAAATITAGPAAVATPDQMLHRLARDQAGIGRGSYLLAGTRIQFESTTDQGVVSYAGTVEGDKLTLHSHSFINGRDFDETYEFLPVAGAGSP